MLAIAVVLFGLQSAAPFEITVEGKGQGVSLVLRRGGVRERLAFLPGTPPRQVALSHKGKWAVYDDRGLSVRVGNAVRTFKLLDYALSPKLWKREEILANRRKVTAGTYRKAPSVLAGAAQHGSRTFWLLQWSEPAGEKRVWLEALLKLDLSEPEPRPKLAGSPPSQPPVISSRRAGPRFGTALTIQDGGLYVVGVTRKQAGWGFARLDLKTGAWKATRLLDQEPATWLAAGSGLYYLLPVPAGSEFRRAELKNGAPRSFHTARTDSAQLFRVGTAAYAMWKSSPGGKRELTIRNLQSGSENTITVGHPIVRAGRLAIAVFDSADGKLPTRVLLLHPERLYVTHEVPVR